MQLNYTYFTSFAISTHCNALTRPLTTLLTIACQGEGGGSDHVLIWIYTSLEMQSLGGKTHHTAFSVPIHFWSTGLIVINFHPQTAEKKASPCMIRLDLANWIIGNKQYTVLTKFKGCKRCAEWKIFEHFLALIYEGQTTEIFTSEDSPSLDWRAKMKGVSTDQGRLWIKFLKRSNQWIGVECT